ncbi:transcription termination factor MTEF18, mitochondrial-like [Vicia villosa]|uniref:transcription termination factor MTEF18, mitochondrial-like n=1 Tax=Vicia villosa TaxID=3911 RepID=UPI00273AB04B|nr:transcription termination factor MTEF18, mitochondrial-like [Vicia villosa]
MVTPSLLHNLNLPLLFNPSTPQNPISSISLKPSQPRCSNSAIVRAPSSPPPIRIKPYTKIEAQHALQEYLYNTQCYTFIDAEFIAKNSPHFIHQLISRVRVYNRHYAFDFPRALRRYLMYHPINEFEPFLESIGIHPRELNLLLPKDLFFLRDDSLLVDNFHVLFIHGVPRNRMWKIYREAREVFGYGSGVLSKKFESYENLGLSKSSVAKLFVCCPLLLVGDEVDPQFVVVLDWLKRIGIDIGWFVNCMWPSRTYRWKAIIDSIEFFRQGGCSEKPMYDLFKADPKLLLEGLGKRMYLVIGRLVKLGLDVNEICFCFREHPDILSSRRMKNLMSVIAFMYNIRMEQEETTRVLYNYMHILSKHSIKGHTTMSKELGVGKGDLREMIQDDPLEFFSLAVKLKQKKDKNEFYYDLHLGKTSFLRKLGYNDNSEEMEIAMKMFEGKGDKLQERFDCLVEAGLEYDTVVGMVKRVPGILSIRKTVMQKKIDFLKNTLGYPIEFLARYSRYFFHNLDKIFARFAMYKWLKKRNVINRELYLSTIITPSEKQFLELFVNTHPEGPTAWQTINSLSKEFKN